MIGADNEVMAPQVMPPMVNGLDKANPLSFVGGEVEMA